MSLSQLRKIHLNIPFLFLRDKDPFLFFQRNNKIMAKMIIGNINKKKEFIKRIKKETIKRNNTNQVSIKIGINIMTKMLNKEKEYAEQD